jgi:anti-sigma-K factor RskA
MSDPRDHIDPPDDDLLAAEYVLGVLDAPAREAAARRIARERDFAALVSAWETRLVPWTADIAPVQPPLDVWNRISAALPAERVKGAGLWSSLTIWRWLTFSTGALAAACLAALIVIANKPVQQPLVATIAADGRSTFVATIDPARGAIAVVPAAYTADPARVPELWLIAPGDKPRSLGVINPSNAITLAIPAELRPLATVQAVLAISLEPPGGSPTGAPTGPVIATGKLTAL